jgi:hypothetical protein
MAFPDTSIEQNDRNTWTMFLLPFRSNFGGTGIGRSQQGRLAATCQGQRRRAYLGRKPSYARQQLEPLHAMLGRQIVGIA